MKGNYWPEDFSFKINLLPIRTSFEMQDFTRHISLEAIRHSFNLLILFHYEIFNERCGTFPLVGYLIES
jgi:hypothetical protein